MAVINDPNTAANIAQVGPTSTASTQNPLHVSVRPLHGIIGHYRTAVVLTMATSQAANSRLFEIRNPHASNLIVPTRIRCGAMTTGTVTTAYLARFGLWRCTSFSAIDTTNTVTPTGSVKRNTMTAYPGNAVVRHNTVAGAAAGMTGGTLTKDGNESAIHLFWTSTAVPTAPSPFAMVTTEMLDDVNGTHPFVFAQNEGFIIENVTAGSATSNVVQVLIDVSWAEVTAF